MLAALVVPAVALGRVITETKVVNLDGDPDLEQVIPQEPCLPFAGGASSSACTPDQFVQRRIVVEDTCNGAPYAKAISSAQEAVIKLEVSNFTDITDRPEIFFDLRSGAGGRVGEIRVVSWEDGPTATACPCRGRSSGTRPSERAAGSPGGRSPPTRSTPP